MSRKHQNKRNRDELHNAPEAQDWAFTGDEQRAAFNAITDEQFAAFSQHSFVAIAIDNPRIIGGDDDGFEVTEAAEKKAIKRFFVVPNPFWEGGIPLSFQKNGSGPNGKSPMSGESLSRVIQILEQNQILLQKQFNELINLSQENTIKTAAWLEALEEILTPEQRKHHHEHFTHILGQYSDGTHPNLQPKDGSDPGGDQGGEAEAGEPN